MGEFRNCPNDHHTSPQYEHECDSEGVETAAQLAQLRALKCEYGQGYCFSKPVDCKAAEQYAVVLGLAIAPPYQTD